MYAVDAAAMDWNHMTEQSESEALILSVLDRAAISSASLTVSASDRMPLRWRACMARMADSLSALARLCIGR